MGAVGSHTLGQGAKEEAPRTTPQDRGRRQAPLRRGNACGLAGVREAQVDMRRVHGLEGRQLQSRGASVAAERCGVTRQTSVTGQSCRWSQGKKPRLSG